MRCSQSGSRSILTLMVLAGSLNGVNAETITVNGPGNSFFTTGPWGESGGVAPFNVPFARLDAVRYSLYTAAEVQQRFVNSGSFNIYPSVNGRATVTVRSNGSLVGSASLFPSGFGVIPPHSSGTVAGFDQQTVTGNLPTNPNPGPFVVSADAGSGPAIQSLGSLQVIYDYTPIGLTQEDPILPTSGSGTLFTFAGVPSGRWFDPNPASAIRFDMVSQGDAFSRIADFPTGFSSDFGVFINGTQVQRAGPGQAVNLSPGTRSFVVQGISPVVMQGNPRAFPIRLAFNRDGVTFTMRSLCPSDVNFDGGVTMDDLVRFLEMFENGNMQTDLDDGSGSGTRDGGLTIDDLIYFLSRYVSGC